MTVYPITAVTMGITGYAGLFLMGLLVGGFGTLIGAGGGFILVPVLLLLFPQYSPELITSISLAVVCLNTASGSWSYAKMGRIDYRSALQFSAATLPGSVAGAYITALVPRASFNIILGILLIVISVFLMFRPEEQVHPAGMGKQAGVTRTITDKSGHTYTYTFRPRIGVVLSFFVGFLSSLLGIGGGIIHVPLLTTLLGFPVHIATATSHFILAIMALAGTIVHIMQGTFQKGWQIAAATGAGVIIGAPLGARWSHRIKARWIIRSLAFALLLVGIRLLFS